MTSEALDSKSLLAKIRTRGHWEIVIRPSSFRKNRIKRDALFNLVANAQVKLHGREVPMIDRDTKLHIDVEWVGLNTQLAHFLELWRMYMSGQFISITAMVFDWRDESTWWPPTKGWAPNAFLDVQDTIAHMTVATEFACRLSKAMEGTEGIEIAVKMGRSNGRELLLNSPLRLPLRERYVATVETIPVSREVSSLELAGKTKELALDMCAEIFTFFGWSPPTHILGDLQKEAIDR